MHLGFLWGSDSLVGGGLAAAVDMASALPVMQTDYKRLVTLHSGPMVTASGGCQSAPAWPARKLAGLCNCFKRRSPGSAWHLPPAPLRAVRAHAHPCARVPVLFLASSLGRALRMAQHRRVTRAHTHMRGDSAFCCMPTPSSRHARGVVCPDPTRSWGAGDHRSHGYRASTCSMPFNNPRVVLQFEFGCVSSRTRTPMGRTSKAVHDDELINDLTALRQVRLA